ncbi:uncharacterized protein LOC133281327 [Pezoporus flaviventris]|uniref:uncharacterized protein LOC133281327 n=1 Tax=Pezoporus flaviventris TaxID=889875 RepID=UPI002AAF63A9|nr:uncharacterized protein LOC133281327 [Pezoporus flaviventris]
MNCHACRAAGARLHRGATWELLQGFAAWLTAMGQGSGSKTYCSRTHSLVNPKDLLTLLCWSSCCCLLLRAALPGQNSVLELLKSKVVKRKDNTPRPEGPCSPPHWASPAVRKGEGIRNKAEQDVPGKNPELFVMQARHEDFKLEKELFPSRLNERCCGNKGMEAGANHPRWAPPWLPEQVPGTSGDEQRGRHSCLPSCCARCYSVRVSYKTPCLKTLPPSTGPLATPLRAAGAVLELQLQDSLWPCRSLGLKPPTLL